MGVHFSVTPEIQKNNRIRLKLNPKILALIGYDDYEISPPVQMALAGNNPRVKGPNTGMPVPMVAGMRDLYDVWAQTVAQFGQGVPLFADGERRLYVGADGIPRAAIHGQLPYFRVREVKTQVDVADGSTVGLGGLIYNRLETYKDKVPVLGSIPLIGRLFRSEGERNIKRNLMIFVSASQVANNGQRKSDVAINN
jgi:Flp pilus assembly secretin CpaC